MLRITVPIALQNVINTGISAMDVVFLGRVDKDQLAACGLANRFFFLVVILFFGLSSGASVLTAQYWGKRDTYTIRRVMGITLRAALISGVIAGALAVFAPTAVMRVLTNQPALIHYGAIYLRHIGISYIFVAFTTTYLGILRSVENVRVSLFVYVISLTVNASLNYVLVFGKLGMPRMEIAGSAIATAIARGAEITVVLIYALMREKIIRFRLGNLFVRDKELTRDFLRYSVPVVLNEVLWSSAVFAQAAVLGRSGGDAVAAVQVIGTITQLVTVFTFGLANSAAVMVGKAAGAGRNEQAKAEAETFAILSGALGAVACVIIVLVRPVAPAIGDLHGAAADLMRTFMFVSAAYTFFQAFNATNIVGIMRGGGDTIFAMVSDLVFVWLSTLAGAVLLFAFHAPIWLVYLVMLSDEMIKTPVGIWRLISGRWLHNVTRDMVSSPA